jgi:predicted pyridoxine 5'-phosphate oxidase superfamily flavin-nucleotide-binding protein
MGILTADMRRVLDEQQLGFVATVRPDGTPNLSPKGTTAAWDDDHIVFADICSPQTVANLRVNPAVEINVVDPILRKGFRFRGTAEVIGPGARFDEIDGWYRRRGSTNPFKHIVLVTVAEALPLWSPAYDQGRTEAEVAAQWEVKRDALRAKREAR